MTLGEQIDVETRCYRRTTFCQRFGIHFARERLCFRPGSPAIGNFAVTLTPPVATERLSLCLTGGSCTVSDTAGATERPMWCSTLVIF